MGGVLRAPYPAAQLVQLAEAESLGVLDKHDDRVGTSTPTSMTVVESKRCISPSENFRINLLLLGGLEPAVQQADAVIAELILRSSCA